MKKALVVGLALVAAFALSACRVDTMVMVNPDGTGDYAIEQEWPKELLAEMLEVPVEDVLDNLEEDMNLDEAPPGATVNITESGDNVIIYASEPFSYDASGWAFGSQSSPPEEASFEVDASGENATFTYDTAVSSAMEGGDLGTTGGLEGIDMNVVITFPGAVTDVTGGGAIDGTTVTWNSTQLETAMSQGTTVSATGSLSGTGVPPGIEEPEFPEPLPEVTETPETQPEVTTSPEPEVTESPEAEETESPEAEEDDDRSDRDDDRPAVADQGSDFPWATILLVGLGVLGLAGVTIAIIFLIRGKRAGSDVE